MKYLTFFVFINLIQIRVSAQVENIPIDNYVYSYLKNLSIKGIITDYDDLVLPLSKGVITKYLREAEVKRPLLSENEKILLDRIETKLDIKENNVVVSFIEAFPTGLDLFFYNDRAKYFYFHKDSTLSLYLNPIIEDIFIYSKDQGASSNLFNFGGKLYGSYSNWFGFSVSASNGIESGIRSVAELNKVIQQNYTFNNTKINNFDFTEGYARIERGKVGIEFGRERVLWGRGINNLIISDNAPVFDFIKFNAELNIFSFDFLHGWLEQPVFYSFDSIQNTYIKHKNPKYIAISRIGVNPSNNISFGITQTIIYANRPLELAYLNPFIFFESAQRSLNDLDNSFLAFDAKCRIMNGLEISSIINFDDIDIKSIRTDGFGSLLSRYGWESCITLTNPIIPENLVISFDYLILRPYMFSHDGSGESLLYTNNSYLIGPDVQPNSIKISLRGDYVINPDIILRVEYDNIRHGNNINDQYGNIVKNVGGNIFDYIKFGGERNTNLLDGIQDVTNKISFHIEYEFNLGFYLGFQYDYSNYEKEGIGNKIENNFWGVFRYNIL